MAQSLNSLGEIEQPARNEVTFLSRPTWLVIGYGVFLAAIIAIYFRVSIRTFVHPFNHSRFDSYWACAYLGICLAIGILVWPKRGRLLLALSFVALAALLVTTVVRAGTGPALMVLLWLVILAQAMGARLLGFVARDADFSHLERVVFAISLGFGLLCLLTFGVAAARILYAPVVLGILVLLTLLLSRSILKSSSEAYALCRGKIDTFLDPSNSRLVAFVTAACLVALVGGFIWAVAPETSFDALNYRLADPQIYVQKHGLVELPYTFFSYFVGSPGMLYALALCLTGQPLPQFIHLLFGLLLVAMTFLFARRLVNARAGFLSAVLLYSLPLVTWESGTAYTDLIVSLYAFGGVYAVIVWSRNGRSGWLAVGSLMAGFSVAAKVSAMLVFIPAALVVIYYLLARAHSWRYRADMVLRQLMLPALIVSAPWFVINVLWTGNPVFPFLNAIFRSPFWPAVNESFNLGTFGRGSGIVAFLLLPWDLTVNTNLFVEGFPGGTLGIIPLLGLPLFLLFWDRSSRRSLYVTVLVTLLGILLWFKAARYARYFLPFTPAIALMAALNLETLYQLALRHKRLINVMPVVALLLGLTYLAASRVVNVVGNWNVEERYPYTVAFGLESREMFLSRVLPVYDAFDFLNRQEGGQAKVLSMGNEFRLYTTAQIEDIFGSRKAFELVTKDIDSGLIKGLQEQGYHYLLVNWTRLKSYPGLDLLPVLSDEFLSRHAQLEFTRHEVSVYKLTFAGTTALAESSNLLKNSSLEDLDAKNIPLRWFEYGTPLIDQTAHAHDGRVAVRVDNADGLFARVAVEPTNIYTLGHWTRADRPNQFARLQINWLDQNLKLVDVSIEVVPAKSEWTWHQLIATSPAGAAFAQVYASVHENSEVWFDDFKFVKGEIRDK